MSPKNKNQKKNEKRRIAAKQSKGESGVNHSNKQQQDLKRITQDNKSMKFQLDQLMSMKERFMKMTPGSPSYDPNWKPSAASDPKIDEKYVKVPTVAETALDQLTMLIDHTRFLQPENISNPAEKKLVVKTQSELKEKIGILKDLLLTPQPEADPFVGIAHLKQILQNAHNPGRRRDNGKSFFNEISIDLWVTLTHTSAATTADARADGIFPGNSAEFASLSNLYDEYICTGVTDHVRNEAASATLGVDWGLAYDPEDSGSYASLLVLLSARQKIGPLCINWGTHSAPGTNTRSGFYELKIKMMPGPQVNSSTNPKNAVGVWQPTAVSDVSTGFLKSYTNAANAGTTIITHYVCMHCKFRSRT